MIAVIVIMLVLMMIMMVEVVIDIEVVDDNGDDDDNSNDVDGGDTHPLQVSANMYFPYKLGFRHPRYTKPPTTDFPTVWLYAKIGGIALAEKTIKRGPNMDS